MMNNDQLDDSLIGNNAASSTKGKGLGIAGMVVGVVALLWAIVPVAGAVAWWLAIIGFVFGSLVYG